ncbi:aminotransferase class V-fold PLP-dependent enzyme [Mycoplasma nasistruthionis]|uniref:Aminotransferase class V-fold PLP-dependent enzyme n=1 Tax=Mycoplasma nasistruthionis TaxID=353852 RepID=A0A5B7XV61_9MOLU|nr:aminotransferase class V-fold PLP-dependent enzyme [Mycoplasma nasistruthionis]QCZ36567.1 aminotransferase class V-fold PLP-dependent enzyme [Mycoplasma nasistruthionis]
MKSQDIRDQFPSLKKVTYFDSAALVLKPQVAIDAMVDYYTNIATSSRSADTPMGNLVNSTINRVRDKVADLLDASPSEIIFTSGTTESINLFAQMFKQLIKSKDIILLNAYNHSSNIIPWLEMAKEVDAEVIISEDITSEMQKLGSKIKLVAFAQETNTFNQHFDINQISALAKANNTIIFNDAAQAISHEKVSMELSDIVVFSTNKFYGPTGMGVLAIKKPILTKLRPVKFGGGSVNEILKDNTWSLKKTISAFEPGTPDIAGFFMFDKSLDFFESISYNYTQSKLNTLSKYLHEKLNKLENVEVFSKSGDYIALINVKDINAQDVATYLGTKGIVTIAGIFCAPYLRNIQQNYSFLRISLGIYNNFEDIDKLIHELENGGDFYAF